VPAACGLRPVRRFSGAGTGVVVSPVAGRAVWVRDRQRRSGRGWWLADRGEQAEEGVPPGPVLGQMGRQLGSGGARKPCGDVDGVGTQGGGGGLGVEQRGQGSGGAQQVVGHRPQGQPRGVGLEVPGGQVRERAGLPVRDGLLDHSVAAVVEFGGLSVKTGW
jgi:hypothetical protein